MRILGIDTSGGSAAALVETTASGPYGTLPGEDRLGPLTVLGRRTGLDPRRHAEVLTPLIAEMLATHDGVDLVAVGTGPAPFTGLRVGLVTARVFARGRGIGVHGVSSLDVLARQALDVLADGSEVLVATDARRREVYAARYRAAGPDDVERVAGPDVAAPAVVGERLEAGTAVTGSGAALYPDLLPPAPDLPVAVDPAVLARLVAVRLARAERGADVELGLEPHYLRRPDVQVPGAAKRVS